MVNVPFTERCREWNALLVWKWSIVEVVRVTTDAGITGWGETLLHYSWGRVSDEAVERVKGRNPADFLGDDSLGPGLQMALYDVAGKALGVPVYRLLNLPRVRQWCPIAWWNTKMPPEALAGEAKDAVTGGYTFHKFKARPWFDVYEQVEAVSGVTPPHYHLDLDWNDMLLTVGNAAPVLRELDRYERVAIYEGPIPQRDVEGYRHLRQKVAHSLAIHLGLPPFPVAVREEMCDGFVVSGGVESVLRQGALCAAFEKPFWLQLVGTGITTALCAHLGAVLPFARWPAVTCMNNYSDDLLARPLEVRSGYLKVPEGPGLGIEVDEDALVRYRMEPPYDLPERRHILSVVWPGGRVVHYAHMNYQQAQEAEEHYSHLRYADSNHVETRMQCWEDFLAGNHPVQERGVRLEVRPDDGSKEWAELYARAQRGPVHDSR